MKIRFLLTLFFFFLLGIGLHGQKPTASDLLQQLDEVPTASQPILHVQIIEAYRNENLETSIAYAKRLADQLSATHPCLKAMYLQELGLSYSLYGKDSLALDAYYKTIPLGKACSTDTIVADVYQELANIYANKIQDNQQFADSAKYYISESIAACQANESKRGLLSAKILELRILSNIGAHEEALDKVLQFLTTIPTLKTKKQQYRAYGSVAEVYSRIGEYDQAIKYFEKAVELVQSTEDYQYQSYCLQYLGYIYQQKGKFAADQDTARRFYLAAIASYEDNILIDEITKTYVGVCYSRMAIGNSYWAIGDLNKAISSYEKGYQLAQEQTYKTYILDIGSALANGYAKKGDNKIALTILEEIKPHLLDNRTFDKAYFYETLGQTQKNVKQYKAASESADSSLTYYKQYYAQKDSNMNVARIQALKELEVQYETEKKEQEIALLTEQQLTQELQLEQQRNQIILLIGGIMTTLLIVFLIAYNRRKLALANQEVSRQRDEILIQAQQLESANMQLKELDKFKHNLLALIVHDLKNPLNLILNTTNVKQMQQAATQMLLLVMNILDIQRLEQTTLTLDRQNIPISTLIQQAVDQVLFLAERKNITIKVDVEHAAIVQVDQSLMTRTLVNLLTNAIKYTPLNSQVLIQIQQRTKEGSNSSDLLLEVINPGELVPSGRQDALFEAFEQAHRKKSGNIPSTGLGLNFCKLAVEAHGGHIGIRNIEGFGVAVWIRLSDYLSTKETKILNENTPVPPSHASQLTHIQAYQEELAQISFFEFARISEVLERIPEGLSEEVAQWKVAVRLAATNSNEVWYNQLINDPSASPGIKKY